MLRRKRTTLGFFSNTPELGCAMIKSSMDVSQNVPGCDFYSPIIYLSEILTLKHDI